MIRKIADVNNKSEITELLKKFNSRDSYAFGEIYQILFRELHYFTSSLYRGENIEPSDIIHDIFVKIWQDKKQTFVGLENIKAYLYISIKNGFKNYISHRQHEKKYNNNILLDDDYFTTKIIETETYSAISQAMNLLPQECAKVFRMVLDGWEVDEIALKLNKSKSTVYEHRKNAISIIKNKLHNGKLLTLLGLIT